MRHRYLKRPAIAALLLLAGVTAACDSAPSQKASDDPDLATALASITTEQLRQHTEVLSADRFEGRAPGTKGDSLTVLYLTEQLRAIGVRPGNQTAGTYLQDVPLRGSRLTVTASLLTRRGSERFLSANDIVATFSDPTSGV